MPHDPILILGMKIMVCSCADCETSRSRGTADHNISTTGLGVFKFASKAVVTEQLHAEQIVFGQFCNYMLI